MSARLDACHGKAGAVLVLVFVLGLTSGVLGTYLTKPPPTREDIHRARVNSTLNDLNTHLKLQPDQSEQVREVLDDMIMAEADLLSQVKWNQMEGRRRIMQYLHPDQQKEFAFLLEGQDVSD
jgi:hypothetical protein